MNSASGSGGVVCPFGGVGSLRSRPYCCNQPDTSWQYTNCAWYKDIGSGLSGEKDCRSGCPSDKMLVAMSNEDCRSGAWGYCCAGTAKSVEKRADPMIEQYKWVLKNYMNDPTCPKEMEFAWLLKRDTMYPNAACKSTEQPTTNWSSQLLRQPKH